MNTSKLKIDKLHAKAVQELPKGGPLLYIAVYYYLVTLYGYNQAFSLMKNLEGEEWDNKYSTYIANGHYRFPITEVIQKLGTAYSTLANSENEIRLFQSQKESFEKILLRSKIGQPEYAGAAVGLISLTEAHNVGYYH